MGAFAKSVTASVEVAGSVQNTYFGFAIRESSGGASAVFRVREDNASGKILDTIALAQGEAASAWYGPQGIWCDGPLYFELVSGSVEGSIRHG